MTDSKMFGKGHEHLVASYDVRELAELYKEAVKRGLIRPDAVDIQKIINEVMLQMPEPEIDYTLILKNVLAQIPPVDVKDLDINELMLLIIARLPAVVVPPAEVTKIIEEVLKQLPPVPGIDYDAVTEYVLGKLPAGITMQQVNKAISDAIKAIPAPDLTHTHSVSFTTQQANNKVTATVGVDSNSVAKDITPVTSSVAGVMTPDMLTKLNASITKDDVKDIVIDQAPKATLAAPYADASATGVSITYTITDSNSASLALPVVNETKAGIITPAQLNSVTDRIVGLETVVTQIGGGDLITITQPNVEIRIGTFFGRNLYRCGFNGTIGRVGPRSWLGRTLCQHNDIRSISATGWIRYHNYIYPIGVDMRDLDTIGVQYTAAVRVEDNGSKLVLIVCNGTSSELPECEFELLADYTRLY